MNKTILLRKDRETLFSESQKLERQGDIFLRKLFVLMSSSVFAYRSLLKKHHVFSQRITLPQDILLLPILTKEIYVRPHSIHELTVKKDQNLLTTLSATSGTTGDPVFIPRGDVHMKIYQEYAERFLVEQFHVDKRKTLGIIGFAMGIWIGGIFTYRTFLSIAEKGYPLSLVPVGADIDQILKTIRTLKKDYEQIILMGYPPFIRDLIDLGKEEGVNWASLHIKILVAAEGITEEFRSYIAHEAGLANPYNDIVNIYGTVEMGTMAYETPIAYLIKEHLWKNPELYKTIFPVTRRVPTLAQYDPRHYHFQETGGNIYASSYGTGIPLIRYSFPDKGGVYTFSRLLERIQEESAVDILQLAKEKGILHTVTPFPFVYVYEREGNMLTFSGANIYADELRGILYKKKGKKVFTGKFSLQKKERKGKQTLVVHVELRYNIQSTRLLALAAEKVIFTHLLAVNSEYASVYRMMGKRARPKIVLWGHKSAPYFTGKGKQRWIQS